MSFSSARYDISKKSHTDPFKSVWLSFWISYLHISSPTHTDIHTTLLLCSDFFKFLHQNLLVTLIQAHKACLLLINHENKTNCCRNFEFSKPTSLSSPSSTESRVLSPISNDFRLSLWFIGSVLSVLIDLWWSGWIDFETLVIGFRILGFWSLIGDFRTNWRLRQCLGTLISHFKFN